MDLLSFRILQAVDGVARPARVERATLCLEGRCSIQLSYGRKMLPEKRGLLCAFSDERQTISVVSDTISNFVFDIGLGKIGSFRAHSLNFESVQPYRRRMFLGPVDSTPL